MNWQPFINSVYSLLPPSLDLALINRGRKYRPNAVRPVHTTEVKILPYRPT